MRTKNAIIERQINKERERIEEVKQIIAWIKKRGLLDLPNVIKDAYFYDGLTVKIAPGKESFRAFRQALGKGWQRGYQHTSDNGNTFINYCFQDEDPDCDFRVLLVIDASYADGTICRVKTIGTKEVPIRRIVCK